MKQKVFLFIGERNQDQIDLVKKKYKDCIINYIDAPKYMTPKTATSVANEIICTIDRLYEYQVIVACEDMFIFHAVMSRIDNLRIVLFKIVKIDYTMWSIPSEDRPTHELIHRVIPVTNHMFLY